MTDKFALVTGAGSGIGRAAAVALMQDGWTVGLAGRRLGPLKETATLGAPGRSHCVICDVADPGAVAAAFAEIGTVFGRLDLLFNNAGAAARAVPPSEVFVRLTQASTNYVSLGERGFDALTRLVQGVPARAIDYPDTETAIAQVERLWGEL